MSQAPTPAAASHFRYPAETGDLDARSAQEILNLMKTLNEQFNKTIIMVTHDPEAEKYAGRRLRLQKGKLIDS